MEEKQPLLQDKPSYSNTQACISTRIWVMIYILMYTVGILVSGSAQTQYVYATLKGQDNSNESVAATNRNHSEQNSQSCGNTSTSDDEVEGQASQWNWYINVIEYGIALPVIILAGPMSDKIGRKPLLLWNSAILFISFVIKSLVVYMDLGLFYFVIGSAVEGLSGTYFVFHLSNLAILADTSSTDGKDRTWIMAVYDGMLGVGAFLGYVGTGYLIQLEGYFYPFVISTGFFLVFTFVVAVTLEDPWIPPEKETKLSIFEIPFQICSLCRAKQNISRGLNYLLMHLLIFLLTMISIFSYSSIRTIWTLGWPFCWTAEHIGWYSAISDVVLFGVGTAVLKILHSFCVFMKDEWIIICGYVSSIASFILLGISNTDWMIYWATAASFMRILPIPLLKATMSHMVHKEKQGVLFSNIYLIEATCSLTGSVLFNNIYQQTMTIYKGMVFFIMAGFCLVALILMIGVTCRSSLIVENELIIEKPEIQQKGIVSQSKQIVPSDTNSIHSVS